MQNYKVYFYGNYFPNNNGTQIKTQFYYFPSIQLKPIMHDFPQEDFKNFCMPSSQIKSSKADQIQNKDSHPYIQNQILLEQQKKAMQRNRDRNSISNSLKVFRKFVSEHTIQNSTVNAIISKHQLDYTPEEFIKDLKKHMPKEKNFLGAKYLKALLQKKGKEQNFSIVFRVLLRYYYRKEVYPTIQSSIKMLNGAKRKQIETARKIYEGLH